MKHHLRSLAPLVLAALFLLPGRAVLACDLKNCPHHAEAKSCECPCGDSKDGKKAHACGKEHCKQAKCTDKGCGSCQEHGKPGKSGDSHKDHEHKDG